MAVTARAWLARAIGVETRSDGAFSHVDRDRFGRGRPGPRRCCATWRVRIRPDGRPQDMAGGSYVCATRARMRRDVVPLVMGSAIAISGGRQESRVAS